MENRNITIKEIARLAGVSKGTISKVINNRPGVGEETRRKVLDLIEHLDYHPSSVAQALANNRTSNIGLIIPHEAGHSLNGSYWSSLITSITQRAAQAKYNIMLFTPRFEGELEEMYESVLRSKKVDGLIIGAELMEKRTMSRLLLTNLPFVLIGKNPEFQHYFVDIDNYLAAKSMTQHMIRHGFQRVGFIGGPREFYYNLEREKGYRDALTEKGLDGQSVGVEEYTTELIYAGIDQLIRVFPDVDSIFIAVGGDFMFDALTRIKARGMDIDKIGLAVFDDYRYIDFMEPRLTAVKQPLETLGIQATQMLLNLISHSSVSKQEIILPTTITPRGSCRESLSEQF